MADTVRGVASDAPPAAPPAAPSTAGRLPCFDGLRAIAAISVLGVHTSFVSGFTTRQAVWGAYTARLEIGVAVFFVISGFLLYRPFTSAHFGIRGAPSVSRFWLRRFLRIVPAYWLAFGVITYVLHADTVVPGWRSLLIYLGFGQIYFPDHILTGVTQAWTLCTEMSFYLFIPLYAWVLGRRHRDPARQVRVELAGLAVLCLISLSFRLADLEVNSSMARTMTNWLPAYVDLFALGMFLAVVSAWMRATGRRPSWASHPKMPVISWSLAALCFVWVSNLGLNRLPIYQPTVGNSIARQTLYGLFGLFLVVPAVFGPQDQGFVRWLLRSRPLALLGAISYGIYLWHEAWILMFVRWTGDRLFSFPLWELAPITFVLAVGSAAVSYVLVESPAQRLGHLPGIGHRAPRAQGVNPLLTSSATIDS